MEKFLQAASIFLVLTFVQTEVSESPIPNFEKEVELFKDEKLWFPDENGKPVLAKLEMPNPIPKIKNMDKSITFRLYTRESGKKYQKLKIGDIEKLKKSYFNPERPTRFFSHGWRTKSDGLLSPSKTLREAFLENEDCNLITINWSLLSYGSYTLIRIHMAKMAQHVASFVDFLETQGMNLNNTSLIGISLGAHVVGVAGYLTKNKVNYIIGLDPAYPLYAYCGPECRISPESGNHVEIIHTNSGSLGHPSVLGHFDFYPNGGGAKQPGCILQIIGICSHNRAFYYYIESLASSSGFHGMECDSYEHFQSGTCDGQTEIMGGVELKNKKKGIYYLETNSKKPYAKGKI